MVLVCEGLRNSAVEKPLVHDTSTYTANWGTTDVWQDLESYTFTLASDSYLHLRFKALYYHTGGSSSIAMNFAARIAEGTSPAIAVCHAHPYYVMGASSSVTHEGHGFVRLASGSHTLVLQGYCRCTADSGYVSSGYTRVTIVSIGVASMSDASYAYDLETGGVSCTAGSYTTILSATIDAPATNRQTVLGQMKSDKYTVFIYASQTGGNYLYRNSGDTTSGVYVYKDGAKMDWSERELTYSGYGTSNSGIASYQASAGDSDTIEIKINPSSTATFYGILGIVICPWIVQTANASFPVTLEAPVGATMKITLEPFNAFDYCFKTANAYGFRLGGYKGVVTDIYDYEADGSAGTRCDITYTFGGMQSDDLTLVEVYGKMCIISYIALDTA